MVKCPHCKAEIDSLNTCEEQKGTLMLVKGEAIYERWSVEGIDNPMSFECPECNMEIEELADDRSGAEAFLRGELEINYKGVKGGDNGVS